MSESSQHEVGRDRVVVNTWSLGLAQIVVSIVSYLLLSVLTKGLGVKLFELWVLVYVMGTYLIPWGEMGLSHVLIRFCPGYAGDAERTAGYRTAQVGSLVISSLIAVLMLIFAKPLAVLFLDSAAQWPLVCLVALLLPLEAQLTISLGMLRSYERLDWYALFTGGRQVGELILLGALVFFYPSIPAMVAARIVVLAMLLVVVEAKTRRWTHTRASNFDYGGELKRYMRFGLPLVPASFIWIMVMSVDRNMLAHYGADATVGLYQVSDALALLLLNYTRPINGVLQPRFAALLNGNVAEVELYLNKAIKYLLILLIPGFVGLSLIAEPLIDLISGEEYLQAAHALPVLALAYVVMGLSNPFYNLIFLQRDSTLFIKLYALCLGVNLGLNYWLIPTYQGVGAAVATLVSFIVYWASLLCYCDKDLLKSLKSQIKTLAMVLGGSALMAGSMLGAATLDPIFSGLTQVPVGLIVFAVFVYKSGLMTADEMAILLKPVARWIPGLGKTG